jgi:hypothetical protein
MVEINYLWTLRFIRHCYAPARLRNFVEANQAADTPRVLKQVL